MFPSVREALFSGNSVVTGPIGSKTQRSDLPGSCACPVVGSFTVAITDAGRSNSAAMHLSPVGSVITEIKCPSDRAGRPDPFSGHS